LLKLEKQLISKKQSMLYDGKIDRMLNLTQHLCTKIQKEQGVIEPADKEYIKGLITFEDIPEIEDLRSRANKLVDVCRQEQVKFALVAGAPFWLIVLEFYLRLHGITPLHSFSKRIAYDHKNDDGTVQSIKTFVHAGWIQSPEYTLEWE
jgi:hypothetical protein